MLRCAASGDVGGGRRALEDLDVPGRATMDAGSPVAAASSSSSSSSSSSLSCCGKSGSCCCEREKRSRGPGWQPDAKRARSGEGDVDAAREDGPVELRGDAQGRVPWEEFERAYRSTQAVVMRNVGRLATPAKSFGAKDAAELFRRGSTTLRESWCVENHVAETIGNSPAEMVEPEQFLSGSDASPSRFYGSFIASEPSDVARLLEAAPVAELPLNFEEKVESAGAPLVSYADSFWIFVGRNAGPGSLGGRKLHTDDVPQNGTWHYQARGSKHWFIRPSKELLCASDGKLRDIEYLVKCNRGDIIVLNTRLWWHRTEIPCTASAEDAASISYARDMFLGSDAANKAESSDFTNVDGFYAANPVEVGTVVVREDDMPDVALPRSDDPNCEVAEIEPGVMALVACRDIAAGEWFSVAHSDDEAEDDEEEEGEGEDEEGDAEEEDGDT